MAGSRWNTGTLYLNTSIDKIKHVVHSDHVCVMLSYTSEELIWKFYTLTDVYALCKAEGTHIDVVTDQIVLSCVFYKSLKQAEVNGVLTLPGNLNSDDAGIYTCKGINNVGEDSQFFTLEVYSKWYSYLDKVCPTD